MPGQKSFIGNRRPSFYSDKYGNYTLNRLSSQNSELLLVDTSTITIIILMDAGTVGRYWHKIWQKMLQV